MNTQTAERPLAHAVVTVQYVNPAKQPGKSGSIKDVDGQFFSVWPNMLAMFQPGGTYEIEFTERVKAGVMYRDIKRATPAGPIAPPPAAFVSTAEVMAQRQPQPQRTAPVQQHTAPPAPPPSTPQNGNGYRPVDERTARRMFVCATLTAFVEAGRVERSQDAIAETLDMICAAYDAKREAGEI